LINATRPVAVSVWYQAALRQPKRQMKFREYCIHLIILEALQTATINPAIFLDKTKHFGTIALASALI
jgi:hypothetical protein